MDIPNPRGHGSFWEAYRALIRRDVVQNFQFF